MTSGTKTINRQYSQYFPWNDCLNSGLSLISNLGYKSTKIWSGGDATPSGIKPYTLYKYAYNVYDKKGKFHHVRKRTVRLYPQGRRVPKGEHGYSLDLVETNDSAYNTLTNAGCSNGKLWSSSNSTYGNFNDNGPSLAQMQNSNDTLALIGKLSNKIQGEGFNMAVFLGEGREALGTIAESARRIALSLKWLKHGNVYAASEALLGTPRKGGQRINRKHVTEEWLASNWLQLQYGWKPLVNDIYSAAAHFAWMQNRDQLQTYRVRMKPKELPAISSAPTSFSLGGIATYGKSIKANITRINQVLLLGLANPAAVAWELMPYSFVCDWVLPIGSYLDALNLDLSLTGQYVTAEKYTMICTSASSKVVGSSFNASFNHKRVIVNRTVSSSLGVPFPTVKQWDKVASFGHCVNAIALLTNAVKR